MTFNDNVNHDRYRDDLGELALGILDGRARAELLAHLDTCAECAERLQVLSATSDAFLYLPVGAEPPWGFESGIINRIRATQAAAHQRTTRGWTSLVAAVAVVVGSFGLGWAVDRAVSSSPTKSNLATGQMEQRTLRSNGRNVGVVFAYAGKSPWMYVTLNEPGAPSIVRCTVVTKAGSHDVVGTFTLTNGKGSWGASLPVAPSQVRNVELTSSTGAVVAQLASATWNYPTTVTN